MWRLGIFFVDVEPAGMNAPGISLTHRRQPLKTYAGCHVQLVAKADPFNVTNILSFWPGIRQKTVGGGGGVGGWGGGGVGWGLHRAEVMGHDYNLPFGPWGMEVEPDMRLGRLEPGFKTGYLGAPRRVFGAGVLRG